MKVYSIARGQLTGSLVLLGAALLYARDVLGRWEHLIDQSYTLQFIAFSLALAVLAYAIFSAALCRWNRPILVALAAAVIVFLPARFLNERSTRVLVVSVEGLRADRMSALGARAKTTPNLTHWIAMEPGMVTFLDATAHTSSRESSLAALLSGRPMEHAAAELQELFQNEGRATRVARTTRKDAPGDRPGFDRRLALDLAGSGDTEAMLDLFRTWYRDAPGGSFSLLDYSLLVPPGLPEPRFDAFVPEGSESPEASPDLFTLQAEDVDQITRQFALRRYDGSLLELDHNLGSLLAEMEGHGEFNDTLVVFTSSNGWGYFEHDEHATGGRPFQEVVHVPLLMRFPSPIRFPPLLPRAREVRAPVQHADVLPTIASFLRAELPESPGRDLTRAAYQRERPDDVPIPLASDSGQERVVGVRFRSWKLFQRLDEDGAPVEEAWELIPPNIEASVATERAPTIDLLRVALEHWFGSTGEGLVARARATEGR